ncbi:MAG TPA: ParB N-terminal domain-containing protein [Rugosibacter sp.]|nr:ParB N-terminal domain-containing protein [Rugosibacter sp.]
MKWHTEKRKISDLIPHEMNPRRLTNDQAEQLEASLKRFDLAEIPAVNTNGKILAGHQRLAIMKRLGRGDEVIDCRVPDLELNADEEREYLIRSNKNTGEWDWDSLANDFDMDDLLEWGFTSDEFEMGETKKEISGEQYELEYKIELSFVSETEQEKAFNDLSEQGYKCKVLTL